MRIGNWRKAGRGVGLRSGIALGGVIMLGVALLAGCGGSASETPWPVKPIAAEDRPRGEGLETGNRIDVDKLPDNYTKDPEVEANEKPAPADPTGPSPLR